ncbi:MAG: MFS transporter [Chloroflexota bacterium]|nr:MFS transporter [Chloroflexota bacterium]
MPTPQNTVHEAEDSVPPPRARPLWRNRDYVLLWSGQFVSSFGSEASFLAFPLLMLALTHSPAQAGLLGVLRSLPFALLCLPAGALVDRWDRKRVMILCDSGRAIALGSIPLAYALGHLPLVQLYLVALIEGTLFTFFTLAETACLPNVVTKEQLSTAIAQSQIIDASSLLVGPALSGILYGIGRVVPFLADTVSYLASVCSLFFIKGAFQAERNVEPRKLRTEILEGIVWLWQQPLLRFLALLTCGLLTPCFGYTLILIVLAQDQHASSFTIGLVLAAGGIGNIAGTVIADPLLRRFGFKRVITWTSWIWALTWLPLAFAPNLLLLGIANAIGYIVVPVYMVAQFSYRLSLIPDHLLGRVNSVFRLIAFGSRPIGIGLTGLLLQGPGPVVTVLVLFIPQVLLALAVTVHPQMRASSR